LRLKNGAKEKFAWVAKRKETGEWVKKVRGNKKKNAKGEG